MKRKSWMIHATILSLFVVATLTACSTTTPPDNIDIPSLTPSQDEEQTQLNAYIAEWMNAYWEEQNTNRTPTDHTNHLGYGGTLYCPDGTVIKFPVDNGTESAAYTDFAARFSEEDILFDTDPNGKILLSEDFVGSRYVCFSMKALDVAVGVPYPDIEDHVVSVDVAERWIEYPQPGTIYVLVQSAQR